MSSITFKSISEQELTSALEELLFPKLEEILSSREAGHCMRVSDLSSNLMVALTCRLRLEMGPVEVYVLANDEDITSLRATPNKEIYITSSKLVELRNPNPDGSLRPPLMVFIPANLKVSAEDSFGIATFEEIDLSGAYKELTSSLIQRLPPSLQSMVQGMFSEYDIQQWPWVDDVAQTRFLITALINGVDAESLGASLYELGLVPDFKVFTDPDLAKVGILRNVKTVQKLTYSDYSIRGRVLELGLVNKDVPRRLIQLLSEFGAGSPVTWTQQIVFDKNNWDLSFDKWRFEKEIVTERISITQVTVHLPVAQDENDKRLQDIIGQMYLAPQEQKKINVTFEVDPHPSQVRGLDNFTIQLFYKPSDADVSVSTGLSKKVKVWKAKRSTCTASIDKLNKVDLEEGWYFIRVLPWTEDNDPIPMDEIDGIAQRSYESDLFYVLPNETFEDSPQQRAIPNEESVEHARIRLQFTAIGDKRNSSEVVPQSILWSEKSGSKNSNAFDSLSVKFGKYGSYQVLIPKQLREIEQQIMENPSRLGRWKWQIQKGKPLPPQFETFPVIRTIALDTFVSARSNYFRAVRGDGNFVLQAADFQRLRDQAVEYAQSYRDLLSDLKTKIEQGSGTDQQSLISYLRNLLSLDLVHVYTTNYLGHHREAILVGPTHPLRALWYVGWASVAQNWIKDIGSEPIGSVRDAILRDLNPIHIPLGVPLSNGRVFTSVDNINFFWSLYAATTEEDTRGLIGEICTALNLPEPGIGGGAVTEDVLAARLQKYVVQHPYTRTLKINVFNPGRAALVANAVLLLQKQKLFTDLRYDVRLFVPNPEAPGVGEAVQDLLSPNISVTKEEVDAFSRPSGNHLFPKLSLAILSNKDFYEHSEEYRAHISILMDIFPSAEIGATGSLSGAGSSPLYGLVQDFDIHFQDDEDTGTYWKRQPKHGDAQPIDGLENVSDLLSDLPGLISGALATVATGSQVFDQLPTFTLSLDANQRALIHTVHEVSDWVITIDRNMGIEFYDHGGKKRRPNYLIDFTPSITSSFGHRLVVTTRSLVEIESLIEPVLNSYNLFAQGKQTAIILEQLRSLSGKVALKLSSSSVQQQAEAIGLALAKLYLNYQNALNEQFIVPLDDWLGLYQTARKQADELGDNLSFKRADLALFSFDPTAKVIQCNLVEVKCYRQIGAYTNFKEGIKEQINQSEIVLRQHFDPRLKASDRPDRLLKTREFTTILQFYLDRAIRYQSIDNEVADIYREFLSSLEEGYELQFTKSAIIFDFERDGTEDPEWEDGIEYYRIGINLIRELISLTAEWVESTSSSLMVAGVTSSIPLLENAPFKAKPKTELFESRKVEPLNDVDAAYIGEISEQESTPVESSKDLIKENTPVAQEIVPEPLGTSLEGVGSQEPGVVEKPIYDTILGSSEPSPQYGIIGEISNRKIALDLNQTHTISLFGVQGSGKSYTLGSIIEMACLPIGNINLLPNPLSTVVFHYSTTEDYKPEFVSMGKPNSVADQVRLLKDRYGAAPQALKDIVLLTPKAKVGQRKLENPDLTVLPITFSSSELKTSHWKFLMGAVGSQSMYIRQVNFIMRKLRDNLKLDGILQEIEHSSLTENLKDLARTRLLFASEYIDDSRRLEDAIKPGRLIIVDLRDELIEKDEALGLFLVMLEIFSEATCEGRSYNKLVVFDEAHKYIENQDLITGLIEVVREMRHKGTNIMIASQEPRSVPVSIIELSTEIILHRFNSPEWLKHIQKANTALSSLTAEKMANLHPGEAYIWSSRSSDDRFTREAIKVEGRPRVTLHGGATKTAVSHNE